MVILNLKLDNILAFNDFTINFSYPRKLKQSTIENEALSSLPRFRYKKLNIFMGSNASGKTSLIKSIWSIMLFLCRKEKIHLQNIANLNKEESFVELDCVIKEHGIDTLYRIKIRTQNKVEPFRVEVAFNKIMLSQIDSYESCCKKLDASEYIFDDYIKTLDSLNFNDSIGWSVMLPATEAAFDKIYFPEFLNETESNDYLRILNNVLKTLDPAIIEITRSQDARNAYVVKHENVGSIIVQEHNNLASIPCLSSGTKYGFNIANVFFYIKHQRNGIYLIDEQFSYIDSEIEKAIIAKLAYMLGDDEQLFITTHNHEVANMNLPLHSFYFLNKEKTEDGRQIFVNCASDIENRNNVAAKSIIDNDLFGISADVSMILDI